MKNIKGIIDPWTLGFIISLFSGATAYILHPSGEQKTIEQEIKQVDVSLDNTTQ